MESNIESAIGWLEGAGRKYFGETNARLYRTAVGRFDSVLAEQESRDARSMLKNLTDLSHRYGKNNPSVKSGSLKTYESRARTALQEYLRWADKPAEYAPKHARRAERSTDRTAVRPATTEPGAEIDPKDSVSGLPNASPLQLEVQQALRSISAWPRLARYLLPGILKAMEDDAQLVAPKQR